MSCCSGAHDHDHASHAHDDELDYNDVDLENDPTLAACCIKDQQEYRRAMELKRVLTEHDPTTQNVRARQQVVLPPPPSNTSTAAQQHASQQAMAQIDHDADEDSDDDFDDDDFEDDEFLVEMRRKMQLQMEEACRNAADGYGVVTMTDFARFMAELRAEPAVPRVLLVMASGVASELAQGLQKDMLHVAQRFVGTKFCAIAAQSSNEGHRLGSAVSIAVFRGGERVDSTAVRATTAVESGSEWEGRIVPWLTMCRVLETTRQDSSKAASDAKPKKRDHADDVEPEFDCGVENCRIRYSFAHEHVGPSDQAKQDMSSWRR
ncbi:TPA: hypothetical protein N0F65_007608 [Lagenidium giganteum]|uniref:EF-hand domain-containing protein n=1 Tax=Lagenidium giganteum TaxID=4803 RepID=A0AAV2ZI15_9STRA|nr:TPA: hypothetical protein N0F65_007608 [Lagenidium giganteum]